MINAVNLISLLLGFTAWTLPMLTIVLENRGRLKNRRIFFILSPCACGASFCLEFLALNAIAAGPFAESIGDTIYAMTRISVITAVGTLLANLIALTMLDSSDPGKK